MSEKILNDCQRPGSFRFRLVLYPGVEQTFRQLHRKYRLALISDTPMAYAAQELNAIRFFEDSISR